MPRRTNAELHEIIRNIAEDLVDAGRNPATAQDYARAYTYWRDCTASLGYTAAVAALRDAMYARQGVLDQAGAM